MVYRFCHPANRQSLTLFSLLAGVVLLPWLGGGRIAHAQAVFTVAADWTIDSASADKVVSAFSLPTQTNSVRDSIEEFHRFVEHKEWEKAFASLDTISKKATDGFVERPDHVLVPSRLLVRSLLAGMPVEGKTAYRVFYDAAATALWEKAAGAEEERCLSQIVDDHLISSVGDRAADRLGDLYFERGDLNRAVAAWRTVLAYCPDSEIPKAQLLIKVATALAFAGRSAEFAEVRRAIEGRYVEDTIEVAGRSAKAGEEAGRLAKTIQSADAPVGQVVLDDFDLPSEGDLLWQFKYQSRPDPNNPNSTGPFNILDAYGRTRNNDFAIPAATDGQRVYLNIFGVEMAFDLATGKMLWRTARLHELDFQQARQGFHPEQYALTVVGDRTWSVTREPSRMSQRPGSFSLVARDSTTGKEVFNSRRLMSTWNILGMPFVATLRGSSSTPASPEAPPDRQATAPSGKPAVDFSAGFSSGADALCLNGKAAVVDSRLRLTDGGSKQASSVFTTEPVSALAFETEFEFQFTKAFADGILFVLQGQGPQAIGDWNNGRNGISFEGVSKSVGVKFDIYGEDTNSTGLCLDGVRPTAEGAVSLTESKIDLKSGHIFKVRMRYDGEDLQVAITDTNTQASHSTSYAVDIPRHVGGPRAYVGFTGSSGLLTAVQDVLHWTYTPTEPQKKTPPPADGQVIYVGASRTNKSAELSVLLIDPVSGRLKKDIALGTYAVDPNQIYFDRVSEPSFAMLRDLLFVDTHAGALVALRPDLSAIEWGIVYESPPPIAGYNGYNIPPPQLGLAGPLAAGGLLFAKGMRSPRLIGVDPSGPTVTWRRPINVSAMIVGADDKYLYTGGEELSAYNLETEELVWSTRLPQSVDWSKPVLTKTRIYQFTSRGIYQIDKRTGRAAALFRGADLDAQGGSLFVTPTAIITVSNAAVTAYSLNPPRSAQP